MKVAIYGAGSLGIVIGAYLTKNGIDTDFINRNKSQVDALNKNGATVTGTVNMNIPVKALLPEEMKEQYDYIFLLTKQSENRKVVEFLKPYLKSDGILCTLQNGLPEPDIAKALGEDKVIGGVVEWGATLQGPGVSELTSEPDSLTFTIGCLNSHRNDRLPEVKAILEKVGKVTIEENMIGSRFSKLLINTSFSGMSAVTGLTFGETAKDRASRSCIQRIIKECIDVAKVAGITISPVQGKDIVKLMDYHNPIKKQISFLIIPMAIKKHARLKASMLQDLEKGKKTEVDFINGTICEYGRRYQVPTPYNDTVVRIVHEIEDGTRKMGRENIREFL